MKFILKRYSIYFLKHLNENRLNLESNIYFLEIFIQQNLQE